MFAKSERWEMVSGIFIFLFAAAAWINALCIVGSEENQGDVYRIIYVHVPSALAAFFCSFMLLVFGLLAFRKGAHSLAAQKASAQVGLLFTIITMVTGAIWGKPTWGVWWTWDARLTTTFILSLLFCGYLLLAASLPPGQLRLKACSVLSILIFLDIPIIYKSVTWWRTLHQPPSLISGEAQVMDAEFKYALIWSCIAMVLVCVWLLKFQAKNLALEDEAERILAADLAQ